MHRCCGLPHVCIVAAPGAANAFFEGSQGRSWWVSNVKYGHCEARMPIESSSRCLLQQTMMHDTAIVSVIGQLYIPKHGLPFLYIVRWTSSTNSSNDMSTPNSARATSTLTIPFSSAKWKYSSRFTLDYVTWQMQIWMTTTYHMLPDVIGTFLE